MFAATKGLITRPSAPPAITLNSVGAGASNGSLNANSVSLQFNIDVAAGVNRRIYCYVGVGTDSWVSSFTSIGASSNNGGAFTEITRQQYGNGGGFAQAGLGLYELILADGGAATHTIIMSASFSQALKVLMGNAICFNGVVGRGTVQTQNAGTGSAINQNITVPSGNAGDAVLCGIGSGGSNTRTGAWSSATQFYSVEASVLGEMDWMKLAHILDADGSSKNFTGTNTARHAMAGIRLLAQ